MKPRHRVSRAAIELIKRFEGYRRHAAQLPDGRWTIGHGHTLTARQGAEVSLEDAEALLIYDLIAVTHGLNEAVFAPLNQNQFDALTSFSFNIGLDNFQRSAVLKRLNEGELIQAACSMELWRKAEFNGERIVIDALVRRRAAEKLLFLTPEKDAWVAAPSPILRPTLDADAAVLVPAERPATVVAAFEDERVELTREDADLPPAPAPIPPEEHEGLVEAAAEAVSARLRTLFPEPQETTAGEPEPALESTHETTPTEDLAKVEQPENSLEARTPEKPDLRDGEDPAPVGPFAPKADDSEAAGAPLLRPALQRRSYDLASGAEWRPKAAGHSPWPVLAMTLLGLALLAGGVFWAVTAPQPLDGGPSPLMVGGLASLSGLGFIVVAIFLFLERLGRAAERRPRR